MPEDLDDPLLWMLHIATRRWLIRGGKDGKPGLYNVYATAKGHQLRPLGVPDGVWERAHTRDVIGYVADRMLNDPVMLAVTASHADFMSLSGVALVCGAWGVFYESDRSPGSVARVDQLAAFAAEQGASNHPDRVEVVQAIYYGRDGTIASVTIDANNGVTHEQVVFPPDLDPDVGSAEGNVAEAMRMLCDAYNRAEAMAADPDVAQFAAEVAHDDVHTAVAKAVQRFHTPDSEFPRTP